MLLCKAEKENKTWLIVSNSDSMSDKFSVKVSCYFISSLSGLLLVCCTLTHVLQNLLLKRSYTDNIFLIFFLILLLMGQIHL